MASRALQELFLFVDSYLIADLCRGDKAVVSYVSILVTSLLESVLTFIMRTLASSSFLVLCFLIPL